MSSSSFSSSKRSSSLPLTADDEDSFHADSSSNNSRHYHHRKQRLSLGRVSKRAVLSSKRKIWDSNDASIDVAQTAVDHWENIYIAFRGLLVACVTSTQNVYGAAKAGAAGLEHGLLVPVRDWILLPAFWSVEHAWCETTIFLTSDQAKLLAQQGLGVIKQIPVVGEPFMAPALLQSWYLATRAWDIAQYPIPSKTAVRDTVDGALTKSKYILWKISTEISFYLKRLDANITRTLMHTQWKVLNSGPYATLDKLHKVEVLDHLCERYLTIDTTVGRYEFAAHIRCHNALLYKDLIQSGLLRVRGGDSTRHDEWLSSNPLYFRTNETPYLLEEDPSVVPLYFRLPYVNGQRPGKDAPWIRFPEHERRMLETKFQLLVAEGMATAGLPRETNNQNLQQKTKYPTIAHWYHPDLQNDVLVDQKRHAVSFFRPPCPKCSPDKHHDPPQQSSNSICTCQQNPCSPPPISMIVRPTLWRFHGPGDEVRRAVWVLDTKRHGLQPYSDEAAAVLEDAYLFLKWKHNDAALLTVQVTSPDGSEQQLVQFSSLYQVTAIQKTLGGAISLFKRRVYRGVSLQQIEDQVEEETRDLSTILEDEDVLEEDEELWVECANEPPAFIDTHDDDDDAHEAALVVAKKHQQLSSTVTTAPLLALPATELDLEDEMKKAANDDIDHLVLIVHGIGEMLRSTDFFGLNLPNLSSIVDCCGFLRKNHAQVAQVQASLASVRGRVEYIPVEWHEAFAMQSQRQPTSPGALVRSSSSGTSMHDISLRTIPQMRAFANDTLMDVLYFMSPQHHDLIIEIVSTEMEYCVKRFREICGFQGHISVMGHSLGSIITWDILEHQIASPEAVSPEIYSPQVSSENLFQLGVSISDSTLSSRGGDQRQNMTLTAYPQLSFRPQNAFFLGSPIAVFLMIRNQHKPLSPEFRLAGCKNVFNIFHPFDPVAYRIEPLIDRTNADMEPRIVTHWNGGFRVQYQTKRIWKRIVDETYRTQQVVVEMVEHHMTGLGLLDSSMDYIGEDDEGDFSDSTNSETPRRPVCGLLNQGRRIDYMLQEKELEVANEYVAALNAHSSYWLEKDLSLFVARQIVRSSLEAAIQDSEENESFLMSPQGSVS